MVDKPDLTRIHLIKDVAQIKEVKSGEMGLCYINKPTTGEIIEITQSNAWAAERLLAHCFVSQYPDLFPEFDPEAMPLPTRSELEDSTGGAFGSVHDY